MIKDAAANYGCGILLFPERRAPVMRGCRRTIFPCDRIDIFSRFMIQLFIDETASVCYNLHTTAKKEAFSMENKPKKTPCCTALLAHVGASRREPHFYSFLPGPKTGDFSCPVKAKLFQGIKIPPYVVVRCGGISTTYGGRESGFRFAAVFSVTNEVGIDKNISVGYEGKCIT